MRSWYKLGYQSETKRTHGDVLNWPGALWRAKKWRGARVRPKFIVLSDNWVTLPSGNGICTMCSKCSIYLKNCCFHLRVVSLIMDYPGLKIYLWFRLCTILLTLFQTKLVVKILTSVGSSDEVHFRTMWIKARRPHIQFTLNSASI